MTDYRWGLENRLRQALALRSLTQEQLAAVTGLQPSAISHFLSGSRKPNFNNIRKLALALRVTSDYLLGLSTLATGTKAEEPILGVLQTLTHDNRLIAEAVIKAIHQHQKNQV